MRRRTGFRRSFRRRSPRVEMQQISVCRDALELTGDGTCSNPDQFLSILVSGQGEYLDGSGSVPAFAKGVSVSGLRFRYAFSFNSGNVSVPQATDLCTIHSALVLLPVDVTTPGNVSPPNAGFLFDSQTGPQDPSVLASVADYRVLWRGLDKLKLYPDLSGPFGARLESTAYQGQGTALQTVKSKVKVDMDHALCWLIEIAYGLIFDSGSNSPILAADFFGVAAVKPLTHR